MSKTSTSRTFRVTKDLDDYVNRVIKDTGKSRTEVLAEGILMHRAGGAIGIRSESADANAQVASLVEVGKLQADQLAMLNKKTDELIALVPALVSTHRTVAGLNKSVGVMFRNVGTLMHEMGLEPMARSDAEGGVGLQVFASDEVAIPPATSVKTSSETSASSNVNVDLLPEEAVSGWLNRHGRQLHVPFEPSGYGISVLEFEARLKLLAARGIEVPTMPGGPAGIQIAVRILQNLVWTAPERFDRIAGKKGVGQALQAELTRRRAREATDKSKLAKDGRSSP